MTWVGEVYFYVCALGATLGALGTILARNPIRGAMGLLMTIVSIAGLFLALEAQFLAAIQLIIYAGAIVVLFLFVIMLLGPSAVAPRDKRGVIWRTIGGGVFGLTMLAVFVLSSAHMHPHRLPKPDAGFGGIEDFGRTLFSYGLVPFELSSALLLVAVVGAIAVARGKQGEPAHPLPSGQPGLAETVSTSPFARISAHGGEQGAHQGDTP